MSEALCGGSNCDNSFEGFKDFAVSLRDMKGYNGELIVKNQLDKLGISYTSNPLENIYYWKQFQGCGADFKIESYNIELEVKNVDGKVFRSWIIRDWLPRFSFKGERRIVAMPITTKLSTPCLELLFVRDINIVYYDSIKYIIPNRANKVDTTSSTYMKSESSRSSKAKASFEVEHEGANKVVVTSNVTRLL